MNSIRAASADVRAVMYVVELEVSLPISITVGRVPTTACTDFETQRGTHVGKSIYSGFTHTPHPLILDSLGEFSQIILTRVCTSVHGRVYRDKGTP